MSSLRGDRTTVLVLIKGLGVGGAERLVAESARVWNAKDYDYHVAYVLPWKNQLVAELEHLGVPTHMIGSSRGLRPGVIRRLRELVHRIGADVIHAHLPATGILARLSTSVPVVYTEHNLAASYRLPTRLANRWTYARNAAVTAVSDAVADSLTGYPGPEPIVIPNGVSDRIDDVDPASVRSEFGVGPDERLVVHVGNIRPHKGHDNLIAAARIVIDAYPSCRFVSVGGEKHPGDLQRVRSAAASAGLNGYLTFTGRRMDARSVMAAADVVANPADVEGLPVSLLEAMMLRRPVVATSVGGVPTIVHDGATGLLVPPGDPRALAEGIADLLRNPETAHRLGSAGHDLVSGEYGIEPMVHAHERLYQRVAHG